MNNSIDFTKLKKTFLAVTLNDGKKISVKQPTKKIMDIFINLNSNYGNLKISSGENINTEDGYGAINAMYDAAADILSNNIANEKITVEYLSSAMDMEDLIVFFQAYAEFIGALQDSAKN